MKGKQAILRYLETHLTFTMRYDDQLHHEERYRSGAVPQDCPGEQGLANGDLSPGDAERAGRHSTQLHQRNISGVP